MKKEGIFAIIIVIIFLMAISTMSLGLFLMKDPEKERIEELTDGETIYLDNGKYELWGGGLGSPDVVIRDPNGTDVEITFIDDHPANLRYTYIGHFQIEHNDEYIFQIEGPNTLVYITHVLPTYPYTMIFWGFIVTLISIITMVCAVIMKIILRKRR